MPAQAERGICHAPRVFFGENEVPSSFEELGNGTGSAFGRIRIDGVPTAPVSHYQAEIHTKNPVQRDGCWNESFRFKQLTTSPDTIRVSAGESASPGQGVHVWYAGFWTNGTLFDTNIEDLDQSDWPRASWYATEPYETLPVYVYDQARTERPIYWASASSQVPRTSTPVDDVVGTVTGTVDGTLGLGYYTTIKGFNDALKGLSTNTARVVVMQPEDAYPNPIEGAPGLGGSALVFLIHVADVVDLPCPSPPLAAGMDIPCPSLP